MIKSTGTELAWKVPLLGWVYRAKPTYLLRLQIFEASLRAHVIFFGIFVGEVFWVPWFQYVNGLFFWIGLVVVSHLTALSFFRPALLRVDEAEFLSLSGFEPFKISNLLIISVYIVWAPLYVLCTCELFSH